MAIMANVILWVLLCASTTLGRSQEMSELDASSLQQDPFHRNMMVNTSFKDADLERYLWKGVRGADAKAEEARGKVITYSLQSKTSKRAVTPMGPLINIPCLFCQGRSKHDAGLELETFTPDSMISRKSWGAKLGKCLFYGQRPPAFKNHPTDRSLSEYATNWGCVQTVLRFQRFRTIWQLWPYEKSGPTELNSCETGNNYYCLDYFSPEQNCCWLNALLGEDKSKHTERGMAYFKAMSRAMAMTCTGEVFVMLDNKKMLRRQYSYAVGTPSIWLRDELPELQKLYNAGVVTKLTVVRVADNREFDRTGHAFRGELEPLDFEENDEGAEPAEPGSVFGRAVPVDHGDEEEIVDMAVKIAKAIKEKEAELILTGKMEEAESEFWSLRKRGICPSGADQEAPGMDYFG